MSLTNGKSEAARPRIPKKRVLTAAEMRSKASYRAMERLLESTVENEEQLWSIARIMSGEEFLAASEERCLAGLCGNALCSHVMPALESKGNFQIDATKQKVYAAVEGPGYCGIDCAAASKAFAHRLGSGGQAMHRFERLMEQLREKKRKQKALEQESAQQASTNGENSATPGVEEETTPSSDAASPAGQPVKPKGVLKKKSDLAAGNAKVPIMAAEVKEREQPIEGGAESPKPPSARKTHAIEGYVPKAALKQHRKERKEGRRVRFSDADEYSDGKVAAAQAVAENEAPQATANDDGCDIFPSGYGWKEEEEKEQPEGGVLSVEELEQQQQQHQQGQNNPPLPAQPAVFVLDVEDADGPIEGAEHALSSKFGRLRVANEQELQEAGLPVHSISTTQEESRNTEDKNASSATSSATTATTTASTEPSVDEILAQRLRQGASKYFPQLAATLPPELAQTLEDSASEAGSSEAESGEEWMLSDTESDDGDGNNFDTANGSSSSGRFRARPTFFGQLVTNLDAWVTDSTVELLQSGPEETFSSLSTLSASVPEIETALSRFIAFALPTVMEKLAIGMPKGEVERNLMELIKTLQLVSALPAFTTLQWQLAVMTFLKALSIERVPGLRPAFETREGVHRVNQVLTANAFTIEEFVAVLEILLESG